MLVGENAKLQGDPLWLFLESLQEHHPDKQRRGSGRGNCVTLGQERDPPAGQIRAFFLRSLLFLGPDRPITTTTTAKVSPLNFHLG